MYPAARSPPKSFQKRAQMRRVSLPTALTQQQQQQFVCSNRSPRSRTPNSLSPKLGFLKEISEFDANLDPPFISPAASSSSSADNSHCNSPMLLSPCNQRPASARLYRRNRNGSQPIQPSSPIVGDGRAKESSNVGSQRKQSTKGTGRQSFVDGDGIDDGFRWTDVDGFYGRKNSIPLQQLLANDLALLNGIGLKNATSNVDKLTPMLGNGGSPPAATYLDVDQNNGKTGVNIPSDITEDEDEDKLDAERKEKRRASGDGTIENGGGLSENKSVLNDLKKSASAIDSGIPKSSPTKRRLMMISNRLYSLEEKKKGKEGGEEEEDDEEEEAETKEKMGPKKTEAQKFLMNQTKVKFMDSLDELELAESKNGIDEDVRLLRKALKARKKRNAKLASTAQQLRHFNIDQHGKMVLDSGIRTLRAKLHPGKPTSPNPPATLPQPRNPKARRSTCPEIWLSTAEDEQRPLTQCAVRLFGCTSVGKKCIAKQLAISAEVNPTEDDIVSTESEDLQRPYRTVSFLLNEHEINMEIIQGSMLPESRDGVQFTGGELTIFAVVYSVDHRESFIRAAQILYRLYGDRRENVAQKHAQQQSKGSVKQRAAMERACVPLILIANKSDLQRKRRVSSIEGKMLAKIYKCPFVEMSALLSANVDILWREVLRKLHKYLQARERLMLLHKKQDSVGSSESGSSPRLLARQPLVGRIVERTRRFAKSCEDWISARIVAI